MSGRERVTKNKKTKRRSGDASSGGDGKLTVGGTVDGHIKIAVMTRCYYIIIILPVSNTYIIIVYT